MMYNIHKLEWDYEIIESLGLDYSKMPEVKGSLDVVGVAEGDVARKLGLEGCIIVNGGGDRPMEALGAGIVKEDIAGETTGTATNVFRSLNRPKLDPKKRIICSLHVIPGRWLMEGGTNPTGAILRWFRDIIAIPEVEEAKKIGADPYDIITKGAGEVPPGAEGLFLIPFFEGSKVPYWNPWMRGAFIGLSLHHDRRHLARSIMEGIAFLTKQVLSIEEEVGGNIKEVRVLGGASKSKLWVLIKASVWNKRAVRMKEKSSAALGAAMTAVIGYGLYSVNEAIKRFVKIEDEVLPYDLWIKEYSRLYKKYLIITEFLNKLTPRVFSQ